MDCIYVYHVCESKLTKTSLILYGIDAQSNIVEWHVYGIPSKILYLEHTSHAENIDQKDVHEFIPCLRNLEFTIENVQKKISPVVSFDVSSSSNLEDVPSNFCYGSDSFFISDDNNDNNNKLNSNGLNFTKVCVLSSNYDGSVQQRELFNNRRSINTLPNSLFGPTSKFTKAWIETIDITKLFMFKLNFHGIGVIYANKKYIVPKQTHEANVFTVNFEELISQPNIITVNTPPVLKSVCFNICFLDWDKIQDKLYFTVYQWDKPNLKCIQPTQILFEKNNEITPSQLSNSHILVVYKFPTLKSKLESIKFDINKFVCIDAFVCFNQNDIIPRSRSKRLSSLASEYLNLPPKPTIQKSQKRLKIIVGLFRKFFILDNLIRRCEVNKCPLQQVCNFSILKTTEWLLTRHFYDNNYIIRFRKSRYNNKNNNNNTKKQKLDENDLEEEEEEEDNEENHVEAQNNSLVNEEAHTGGLVLDAVQGIHDWVLIMDFMSHYPSIIRCLNLCFTTLSVWSLTKFRSEIIDAKFHSNYFQCNNTNQNYNNNNSNNNNGNYSKSMGIIPLLCATLLDERNKLKALISKAKNVASNSFSLDEKIQILEGKSQATKLSANSIYGCLANPSFCFYNQSLAQYITGFGQYVLKKTKEIVESPVLFKEIYPNHSYSCIKIIGGDSDSLMVTAQGKLLEDIQNSSDNIQNQQELLREAGNVISQAVRQQFPNLNFQVDQVLRVLYKLHKKQHCGIPIWCFRDQGDEKINTQDDFQEFDISKCIWKGVGNIDMGVARFVQNLRSTVLFELMFIMAGSDTNFETHKEIFLKRLEFHLKTIAHRIKNGLMAPEEFIVVNRLNQANKLLYQDGHSIDIPLMQASKAAKILQNMYLLDSTNNLGEYIMNNETIEYIIIRDFTTFDNEQAIPFHVFMNGNKCDPYCYQINYDWYITHIIDQICRVLKPFCSTMKWEEFVGSRIYPMLN